MNTFEFFYKKQIRKDLIDKISAVSCSDVDFSCNVEYKSYLKSLPSDKNFNRMESVCLSYLYYLESFFAQKVLSTSFHKKNPMERDALPTCFYFFNCSINKHKDVFFLLQRLYICLLFQKSKLNYSKPEIKISFHNNNFAIQNFDFLQTPWTLYFRTLPKDLVSSFCLNSKNLIILFFILDRLNILKYFQLISKDKSPLNQSNLFTSLNRYKTANIWSDSKLALLKKPRKRI